MIQYEIQIQIQIIEIPDRLECQAPLKSGWHEKVWKRGNHFCLIGEGTSGHEISGMTLEKKIF